MLQIISLILNALLTSGFLVTLFTLRSSRKKASAEARSAEIDNAEKLVDNFDNYIVKPLKTQVDELRMSVQNLQMAIRQIAACPHRENCPVVEKLDQLAADGRGGSKRAELPNATADHHERKLLPPPAEPEPL